MNGAGKLIAIVILFIGFIIIGVSDLGINEMLGGKEKRETTENRKATNDHTQNNTTNNDNSENNTNNKDSSIFKESSSDESIVDISKKISSGELKNENGILSENKNSSKTNKNKDSLKLKTDEYKLVRVIDGDTIVVETEDGKEERVRLLLIDTPESVHPDGLVEAYGVESSDYAKEYFKGVDTVRLELGKDKWDKYDRLLAHVYVDDENFGLHMVEEGYARVAYVYEPNTKYVDAFRMAEKKAKNAKLNIWSIDGYVTDKGFDMSVIDDKAS